MKYTSYKSNGCGYVDGKDVFNYLEPNSNRVVRDSNNNLFRMNDGNIEEYYPNMTAWIVCIRPVNDFIRIKWEPVELAYDEDRGDPFPKYGERKALFKQLEALIQELIKLEEV